MKSGWLLINWWWTFTWDWPRKENNQQVSEPTIAVYNSSEPKKIPIMNGCLWNEDLQCWSGEQEIVYLTKLF
jgi:hypothetical protein